VGRSGARTVDRARTGRRRARHHRARTGATVKHLGTIAGRVCYAFDNVLLFAKAGGAWAHDEYRAFNANTAIETLIASANDTRWGWIAGGGVEWGFAPNWSAKIEFDYLDFGGKNITISSIPGATPPTRTFHIDQQIVLVKVGVNYRFVVR
jgi:outer membrane immunogenic protein